MSNCPICSSLILRHIRHNEIYWYCSSCHQEIPNLNPIQVSQLLENRDNAKILSDRLSNIAVS